MRGVVFPILCLTVVLAGCGSGTADKKNGRFLEKGKEYAEKKDYARAALQFRNEAKLLPKSPEPYYQLGLAYLGMHDRRSAYGYFKKAVELDPNHTDAQIKLAELTALTPDKDLRREAEERAKGVLHREPGNADALTVLGLIDIASGKEKQGEQEIATALHNAPAHLKSAAMLASLKLQQNDRSGAEAILKSVVDRDPNSAEAVLALGRFYTMVDRRDDALLALQRAVELQPNNGEALLSLAKLQIAVGRTGDGEQNLRKLSSLPDKDYRTAHATYLFGTNRTAEAIAEMKQIYSRDQNDLGLRTKLVRMYLATQRQNEAEKLLDSALKENAKDTEALLLRSTIRLTAGNYTGARNDVAH